MPNVTIEKRILVPFLSTPVSSDLVCSSMRYLSAFDTINIQKGGPFVNDFTTKILFFERADNICIDNIFADNLPLCPAESSLLICFLICFLVRFLVRFLVDVDCAKLGCVLAALKIDRASSRSRVCDAHHARTRAGKVNPLPAPTANRRRRRTRCKCEPLRRDRANSCCVPTTTPYLAIPRATPPSCFGSNRGRCGAISISHPNFPYHNYKEYSTRMSSLTSISRIICQYFIDFCSFGAKLPEQLLKIGVERSKKRRERLCCALSPNNILRRNVVSTNAR